MSDNIPLAQQRQCAEVDCEDEKYILDIFSYVQPEHHGRSESRKQLFLFITRAVQNNRSVFLQEEQTKLGMVKVYSDKFCWKKTQAPSGTLVVKMEMGDFEAVKTVERRKIDEMRLPEKVTCTLPTCNASSMKIVAKLLNENLTGDILLETEELSVKLSLIPQLETKPAVEHEHEDSQLATEHTLEAQEHVLT